MEYREHYPQSQGSSGGTSPFATPRSRGAFPNGNGSHLGTGSVADGFQQVPQTGLEKAMPNMSIGKTYSDSVDPRDHPSGRMQPAQSRVFPEQQARGPHHHAFGRGSAGDAYAYNGRGPGRGGPAAAGYSPGWGRGGPSPVRTMAHTLDG